MPLDTKYLRYPTDYNLITLNLITPFTNGIVNLKPFMQELSLFEDIYSSTISGEVVISDALGLVSKYFLNGTEFIQIQLQKTTQDSQFISRNYRVYKMGKRVTSDSNNYEVYILHFISEEFLLSEQNRLSKGYYGKQIDYIIEDILTTYLKTQKNTYIDKTLGPYDFILPNKKLFETINWLSTYARPDGQEGADMLFYENTKGYYFKSLQNLFAQSSYQTFKYDPKNTNETDMNQKLSNALDFEVLDFFDTLGGTTNGIFSNKVITFDPLQRKLNVKDGQFDYSKYMGSTLNKNPLTNTSNGYKNRLGQNMYSTDRTQVAGLEVGALRMASGNQMQKKNPYVAQGPDAVANDINIEKYVPNRVAQLGLANYMRIKLTVPGDPNLCAGQVVNFNTYAINPVSYTQSGSNSTREPDPFYSGKYLVSAVRHVVKNNAYITIIELIKDSVSASYPAFNNADSLLNQLVNGVQI
jgi:hypothetical protein